jgi:hypothetical protein
MNGNSQASEECEYLLGMSYDRIRSCQIAKSLGKKPVKIFLHLIRTIAKINGEIQNSIEITVVQSAKR